MLLCSEVGSLAAAGCWPPFPAEDDRERVRRASVDRAAPEEGDLYGLYTGLQEQPDSLRGLKASSETDMRNALQR